jgi:uncharacterized membrane protein
MTETHARTVARTISYRIIAMLITALWTGLGNAVIIHIVLAAVHYIMERLWLKIKWGKIAG